MLTVDEHRKVLSRLVALGRRTETLKIRMSAYSNLMVSFLLHQIAAAEAILALLRRFGDDWFPVTSAYPIARTFFEIDVNAHYISRDPTTRSLRYIDFGRVITKRQMDACCKHRGSTNSSWRDGMNLEWQQRWAPIKDETNVKYEKVKAAFESVGSNGRARPFRTWSGKPLRQLAVEVGHEEAYDVFYSHLSSFAHADVKLADCFVKTSSNDVTLSNRSTEGEVGTVLRYSAIFLTCFLELFGKELQLWGADEVELCWDASVARTGSPAARGE